MALVARTRVSVAGLQVASVTMTVWDELKVVLAGMENSGALVQYPDPRVDDNRQPPFRIRLQWWATEMAEELHSRFGDDVKLVVGIGPYPERRPSRPRTGAPDDIRDMDPTLRTVELDAPIVVKSGRTVRGAVRVHNLSADTIVMWTNGHVTAQVVDPHTRAIVAGFAGAQTLPGIHFSAAPGDSVVVPVLVGTASFSPDLGYAVPAGEWAIQMVFELADENPAGWRRGTDRPERRRLRTPLLPITVTGRTLGVQTAIITMSASRAVPPIPDGRLSLGRCLGAWFGGVGLYNQVSNAVQDAEDLRLTGFRWHPDNDLRPAGNILNLGRRALLLDELHEPGTPLFADFTHKRNRDNQVAFALDDFDVGTGINLSHGSHPARLVLRPGPRSPSTVRLWNRMLWRFTAFRGHQCHNRERDHRVHGQRPGLRRLVSWASRRVRPELRAATATVVPDPAQINVLDHQQGVRYQLDRELPEGLRGHVRGNRRLGRADRTAVALRILRAQVTRLRSWKVTSLHPRGFFSHVRVNRPKVQRTG